MIDRIDHNESMVVIRTKIGRAQAVGVEVDGLKDPDVLGTLAGDDTVIVVPRSAAATTKLAARLRELVGLSPAAT
jgi:transcriptional regulator of arginine metabolism